MADYFSLPPGKSIRGNSGEWYRVLETLGAGGNAVTFLVVCTQGEARGVPFALKVFRRLSKPERRDRFLDEIEFLNRAEHPAIMQQQDFGVFEDDHPFIVAEYLPRTLLGEIKGRDPPIVTKISYAVQLLSALVYLESLDPPVVHRDIKPRNIFLKGPSCVLGDFGLAKVLDDSTEEERAVFKESVTQGMPFYYRTPDLVAYAKGEGEVTPQSDVFQLGLTLAHLFTGWNPCPAPPDDDILAPVELEPLRSVDEGIGASVHALLERMLEMNPEDRESASDVFDGWMGLFKDAAQKTWELEGEVL